MEGGLLPWRTQKIICNSPDLDSYGKPLPPPPHGFYWERLENGSWILRKYEVSQSSDGKIEFQQASVIQHIVMPGDTLQGLCLRYNVSATDIRRTNLFSGNNIQFKKTLRVPIEAGAIVEPQMDTMEIKVQKFRNATGENNQEAHLYLEENNWHVEKAIASWKGDEEWAAKHPCGDVFSSEVSEHVVAPFAIESVHEVTPLAVCDVYPSTSIADSDDPTLEPLMANRIS